MPTIAELWRILAYVNDIEAKANACKAESYDLKELEESGAFEKGETLVAEKSLEYIEDLAIDMERHARDLRKKAHWLRDQLGDTWGKSHK